LEVLGRKLYQRALVSLSKEITQSSLGFLVAAIDHLLAHERRTGVALGAGACVLGG